MTGFWEKTDNGLCRVIDTVSNALAYTRMRHFSVSARYRRGGTSWPILVSPGRPETPPLEFDRQRMFIDATSLYVVLRQPPGCLQFLDERGKQIFIPQPGDRVTWKIGGMHVRMRVAERGNDPCWRILFGNREIQIFVEKER